MTSYCQAQVSKDVNHQLQTWVSINSTMRFSEKWGTIADFHIRRNDFIADPSFYFIRFGANYWIKNNFTVGAGYGHMWLAPSTEGWTTFSNENRIYQQVLWSTSLNKVNMLQRFRNELRWQQIIVDDEVSDNWRFTNRVRYLIGFIVPVFKNKKLPSLILADEILVNFGKDVTYNAFDQNRIFTGVKQNIGKQWSYDFGYMLVFQQKSTGYQYDFNNTIRLFFYWSPDWRHDKKTPIVPTESEE